MAGLGKSDKDSSIYLGIAGGYIWQKKDKDNNVITSDHPDFAVQEYEFSGEVKQRSGAQFKNFLGDVVKVEVKDGKFGEQLNVTMLANGESYTFSMPTNNRNSQHFFSALLVADLTQPLFLEPYDFEGKDKNTGKLNGKRVNGIAFKQNGQKLDLRAVEGVPQATDELFKSGNKKIKRFFEDLNDWYVEQINMKVVPALVAMGTNSATVAGPIGGNGGSLPPKKDEPKVETVTEAKSSEPTREEAKATMAAAQTTMTKEPTILAKRKAIKAYIAENYEEREMPKLNKAQVNAWYNLVLQEEELPFMEDKTPQEVETPVVDKQVEDAQVEKGSLNDQLNALL